MTGRTSSRSRGRGKKRRNSSVKDSIRKSLIARARRYERRKAKERHGIHIGGPGAPDYKRGQTYGEVKNWSRPLTKVDVMREARKGRTEIVSKSGFTEEAIKYAERYRPELRLIHGKTVVKRRKRK